jgi:hypothetical protein
MLDDHEVPVASSMIAMAESLRTGVGHPVQAFMCYWTAFNNIYVTLAEQAGKIGSAGTRATTHLWSSLWSNVVKSA